jgi:hypothetical protein
MNPPTRYPLFQNFVFFVSLCEKFSPKLPESFCPPIILSISPSSESGANALLEIESHKPIQGRHKPKQGHTRLNKAIQGSKKNRNTSLVHKVSYLPPRHSEYSDLRLCASAPLRLKNPNSVRESQECTKDRFTQILQPQSPLRLIKPGKAFEAPSPLSLRVKALTVARVSNRLCRKFPTCFVPKSSLTHSHIHPLSSQSPSLPTSSETLIVSQSHSLPPASPPATSQPNHHPAAAVPKPTSH